MGPGPTRSAVEDPIMPPKNMVVSTLTWASPPRSHPTSARKLEEFRRDAPCVHEPTRQHEEREGYETKRFTPKSMV